MCFAFLCHQNVFPIYRELKDASTSKMAKVSSISMILCFSVYWCCGFFGYAAFLESTSGDLLLNFPVVGGNISSLMDAVRLGFGISLVFTYPIVVWEARHCLSEILFGHHPSYKQFFGLNAVIVLATTVVGMFASGIDEVLGIVGSTCSPMLVFILPTAFFLKAHPAPLISWKKMPSLIILVVGILLVPVCVTLWVQGLSKKK